MKKANFMKTLTLALALGLAASTCYAKPAFNNENVLNEYAKATMQRKAVALGYPCSQDLQLSGFYKWMLKHKLDTAMINNAGDPFTEHSHVNALKFEKDVLEYFAPKYGFAKEDMWGLISFSGTDGNNHGIYFGANYLKNLTKQNPIVYISKEAHYSNMRLCDLQNLEFKMIDTDRYGRMLPEAFEQALDPSRPALVVYAMGTTFKGAMDDQAKLNAIIAKKKPVAVYKHVDAALFGGYLPFTKMKSMVDKNVQNYDSIAVSGHKFLGLDEPAGLFLTTKEVLKKQKAFDIPYLNSEMPMINCSRSATAPLKLWWLINHGADERWTQEASEMLEITEWLCNELKSMNYPYFVGEASNTVYMKRPSMAIVDKYGLAMDYDKRLGGDLAHIIVMQHVNKKLLQQFLKDLQAEVSK